MCKAAVLRLPSVDRVLRHPHLPRHIFRLPSRFQLFECPDHLRFAVLALRHDSPFRNLKSYSALCGFWGTDHSLAITEETLRIALPNSSETANWNVFQKAHELKAEFL